MGKNPALVTSEAAEMLQPGNNGKDVKNRPAQVSITSLTTLKMCSTEPVIPNNKQEPRTE